MKIAIITNIRFPVSKQTCFGVENFTYILLTNLQKKGHEITLFASGDSQVPCKLESVHPVGIVSDPNISKDFRFYYEDWIFIKLYARAHEFDVIHSQDHNRGMIFSHLSKTPTISTFHDVWDSTRSPLSLVSQANRNNDNHTIVTVSDYQKDVLINNNLENVEHIYNGINVSNIPFSFSESKEYGMYLGRISQRKGVDAAIKVYQELQKPFHIYGSTNPNLKKEQKLKHEIIEITKQNPLIHFNGSIFEEKKWEAFINAKLFLFPVAWEEPFGFVMAESMACGTPVVAYARGSVPEIIQDGVTGFIVNTSEKNIRGNWIVKKTGIEGLKEAVTKINELPDNEYITMRKACRARVENHFNIEKTINKYEQLYSKVSQLKPTYISKAP